ncbi:hypothetical protein [Streptomyces sp. NPDC001508]|uniref:hypothetical protein n=1 Tax=Streptomyces sp. NPDC001508 TaxID=3154656 RepID=UPI0033224202
MPKFESTKFRGLTLQDDKGIWARFEGGVFETSDAAVAKRLRALPEDYEVSEVKAAAKSDDQGTGGQAASKQ